MFVSPKKKGSPVLWIACCLLLFDLRVFFGFIAASGEFATSVNELSPELQDFVNFSENGNITVAIKSPGSFPTIPLLANSASALSFRASLKGCPAAEQKWKIEYPSGSASASLDLKWTLKNFELGDAGIYATQDVLVDVVLNGSVPVLRNKNMDTTSGKVEVASANAPILQDSNNGKYNMSISVNPTSDVSDGCVLTLEFDKEKFCLAKPAAPTSIAKPAPPKPTASSEKAGIHWIIIGVVGVVLLLIVLGVIIFFCCVKRPHRNTASKAGHSERGEEFTCVSQTVAQKAEDSKANKVAAISVITENNDDLKAANERVAIKPKTPKEASTQKSHVSSMSTKMAQESQVVASKESQADDFKVNSAT